MLETKNRGYKAYMPAMGQARKASRERAPSSNMRREVAAVMTVIVPNDYCNSESIPYNFPRRPSVRI
jgi:hypothetical protein